MRRFSIFAAGLITVILTMSALAQDPVVNGQRKVKGQRRHSGHALKQMDTNNDGRISRDEWNKKPKAFDRRDQNKDGYLTPEEIGKGKRNGKHALKQMDVNNDGRLSRDEWKGDPETFRSLDANNDGVITREELKARRRARPDKN